MPETSKRIKRLVREYAAIAHDRELGQALRLWDMDIPCAPILVDIVVNGRAIKAVAQPTKQAYLCVLDRVT